ncbi:MAG: hypothetical protein HY820_18290 [Acidobacteria bacterium]|nr:hypothetical protein [Acidobacteriota bacterium]
MLFWALAPLLFGQPALTASIEENRQVIRRAVQLFDQSESNWTRFHYLRRREVREFETGGKIRSKRSFTHRNEAYQEIDVLRLIARDDKPLTATEAAQQEERLKTTLANHRARQTSASKPRPRRSVEEEMQLMREFPEALDYRLTGNERLRGRTANIYEFTPRPGYSPKSFKYRVFEKIRGRIWTDESSGEMIQVEAEVFENVGVGFGILGKINKGTRFFMSRTEAAPGIWMPASQRIHFEARVLLVKNMRQEIDVNFSEYKLKPAKVASSESPPRPKP